MSLDPIPFEKILSVLTDLQHPFPPQYLHRFSDLHDEELDLIEQTWTHVPAKRKENLLADLVDLAEVETLVCFDELGLVALRDPEAVTRRLAVLLLAISEDPCLTSPLLHTLEHDADIETRALAAKALGCFVYMGEVEDISEEKYQNIMKVLLKVFNAKEDPLVQRKILEALGYSSDEQVPVLIDKAYNDADPLWKTSAVISMGLSADERWSRDVLHSIGSPNEALQAAAISAAGELEIKEARQPILDLLDSGLDDPNVRQAAVGALARIGGENVRETLEALLVGCDDEEEVNIIEDALDELEFTESFPVEKMFEFEVQDEDELDDIIDLESDPDEDTEK